MDIKTKLEEEKLFILYEHGKKMISILNKKGIFTIEDLINCDTKQLSYETNKKKQFKLFQELLKNKYLGTPLAFGDLLEKEYKLPDFGISKDLDTLGFICCYNWKTMAEEILATSPSFTLMDFIIQLSDDYLYLKNFYINYYLNKRTKEVEEPVDHENDKQLLEFLRNDLANLKDKRQEIDNYISLLSEQITELEEKLGESHNDIAKKELKPDNY